MKIYKIFLKNRSTLILLLFSVIPFLKLIGTLSFQSNASFFHGNTSSLYENQWLWSSDKLGEINATGIANLFPFGSYFHAMSYSGLPDSVSFFLLNWFFAFVGIYYFRKLLEVLFSIPEKSKAATVAGLFFYFNIYVLIGLSGTFLFVIAHCLTSVYLYFLSKSIKNSSYTSALVASIMLSMIAATNLVFCAIALFLSMLCVLLLLGKTAKRKLYPHAVRYSFHLIVFILLSTWILTPLLTLSNYSAESTSTVLKSESFYNNETSVLNVVRGLGDWGFFGKFNGEPYYAYSGTYRDNIFITASLFLPLIIVITLLVTEGSKQKKRVLSVTAVFLALTMIIIGGTNPAWPTSDFFSFIFDHFTSLNVFRNTYKFSSASMIIIAFFIALFLHRNKNLQVLPYVIASIFLVSAFPILTGGSFSSKSLTNDIPGYWYEARDKVNDNDVKRLLVAPDQYFSVFDWDGKTINAPGNFESAQFDPQIVQNSCAGCGTARSLELTSLLLKNLTSEGFVELTRQLSIDGILQRNDFDYSYYTSEYGGEKESLENNEKLEHVESIGQIDFYKIPDALDMIYSPESLYGTTKEDILHTLNETKEDKNKLILDHNLDGTSIVKPQTGQHRRFYSGSQELKENGVSRDFYGNGSKTVTVHNVAELANYDNPPTVSVDGTNVPLITKADWAKNRITIDHKTENLLDTSVSEQDPANCQEFNKNANITLQSSGDEAEISADKDVGCFYYRIDELSPASTYEINFMVTVSEGTGFGYCLALDGSECDKSEYVPGSRVKESYTSYFHNSSSMRSNNARLYIYAPAQHGPSKVSVERPRLSEVSIVENSETPLGNGAQEARIEAVPDGIEQISDPDFSLGKWSDHNASCSGIGKSSTYSTSIDEGLLTLRSHNTRACANIAGININKNIDYIIDFDVDVHEGSMYGFCVLAEGECLEKHDFDVKTTGPLNSFLFRPEKSTENASLFIYSSPEGTSVVKFKKVSIKRVKGLSVPRISFSEEPANNIEQFTLSDRRRVDPTEATFTISGKDKGLIVFQESFNNGWELTLNGQKTESPHFEGNFFSNTWYVDLKKICANLTCNKNSDGDYILTANIKFFPQDFVKPSLVVSGTTFTGILGYLGWDWRRSRTGRKVKKTGQKTAE